jgi:hypothetical protein
MYINRIGGFSRTGTALPWPGTVATNERSNADKTAIKKLLKRNPSPVYYVVLALSLILLTSGEKLTTVPLAGSIVYRCLTLTVRALKS